MSMIGVSGTPEQTDADIRSASGADTASAIRSIRASISAARNL